MAELEASLVIRARSLIDGSGGAAVSPAVVAMAGPKIVFAGPARAAPPFAGARLLELPEACLLPGLIDMHVHPTYYWEEPDSAAYTYDPEDALVYSPVLIGLLAASNLRQALRAGITTVRDMGAVDPIMFDLKRAARKGLIQAPRLYVAGRLIVPTGGHVHYLPGLAWEADGPYGFRQAVRAEIRAGADFIKLANNGADLTQEELNAAVDEAHRLGKKVACHTRAAPSPQMAIEAGVDTFEHGTPSPAEIAAAAAKGIAWTPTLNINQAYLAWCDRSRRSGEPALAQRAEQEYAETMQHLEHLHASLEVALKAGLKLLAGTDSYMGSVRFAALADELAWLVEYGCRPMQAILAATAWPAEVMGWPDLGRLEPGRLADLIAVAGDPLADIRALNQVVLVVRDGQVVAANTPDAGELI